MADLVTGGVAPSGIMPFAEPESGFPPYLLPVDPERTTRNREILAEAGRRLAQKTEA